MFQNKSAFDFFDQIVQERLAIFETAGALKGGRHIWMLARLPRTLRAAGDDEIRPYVLLANSHDGACVPGGLRQKENWSGRVDRPDQGYRLPRA